MPAIQVTAVTTASDLAKLEDEWRTLFYESGMPNPFLHPAWLRTWSESFVPAGHMLVLTVRRSAELIAIAPFRVREFRVGPRSVKRVSLFGAGHDNARTELPAILTRASETRRALRAVVEYFAHRSGDWDWVELSLGPRQGWFEPDWLPRKGNARGTFSVNLGSAASVIVPVDPSWVNGLSGLKRNAREALRRSVNRLANDGYEWELEHAIGRPEALDPMMDALEKLHAARSQMVGKIERSNHLDDRREAAFLREGARRMNAEGHASPYIISIDGTPRAGVFVLQANGAMFLSLSGLDPGWWDYGLLNLLFAEVMREGAAQGYDLVNLSVGPTVAKLRWSEELEVYHQFALVGRSIVSRSAFIAAAQYQTVRQARINWRRARDLVLQDA
jgi:CelD/BcsL family acetyltransferase involved in cellulose biosynthesis